MNAMNILIKGGLIVDGSGAPAFVGDVLIENGRIAAVEPAAAGGIDAPDAEVVPAQGLVVTPGFIDAHAHSDAYLILEPTADSKVAQGITTEINGQCGGSAAPRYGEARLSSDWASILGERLRWRSFAEYRQALEDARPAVNAVMFVGHNTVRASVVGYAGRAADPGEIAQMQRFVDEAFDCGAKGISTGLIYQPGKYAQDGEIIALLATAARHGGIYSTHMRSEGDRLLEAIDEVGRYSRATGIRAEISHFKTSGQANWHKLEAAIAALERGRSEGWLMGSDRYPYTAAGTDLDVVLPDWAGEGGTPAECRRLEDPALRARIVRELDGSGRDWQSVMVGGTWSEPTRSASGRTIAELAHATRQTPGEVVCQLLAADAGRTGAFFFTMSEANLDRILELDWIVPGSDASLRKPSGPLGADHPHPRAYGTMSAFYRRLRRLGISCEQAVRRMTALPAERFGLSRRGVLAPGAWADVLVWDEAKFDSSATYAAPHRFCTGMRRVYVNGVLTWCDDKLTGRTAGMVL